MGVSSLETGTTFLVPPELLICLAGSLVLLVMLVMLVKKPGRGVVEEHRGLEEGTRLEKST